MRLRSFARVLRFSAITGCAPLVLVASAMLAVTGCSSRRHKRQEPGPLAITTTSLPDGYDGQIGYSAQLNATGGTGSYTWSIVSGSLPPNLNLDPSTGVISGNIASNASSSSPYTFTVEVTDGQRSVQADFSITVDPAVADFSATPTMGTAPLTVTFTNQSTGGWTSAQWDFDNDGTVDSTQQNPTHTYDNPGWYTVKLTVSDGANSSTCVKEMYILVANAIWYVNGNGGDDANGGTDWSDAFATIGRALSAADDYDLILVADATYNETNLKFNGKKIYLKGVDHNNAGQRPAIDCQQAGRAFYFGSGESKDSVVDNFIIRNGKVENTYGGAIACMNYASPTIKNCVFEGNQAVDTNGAGDDEDGGAIYCEFHSKPTVLNCTFSGNSADYGGAIHCDICSSPTIQDCTFSDNSARCGGAIACHSSSNPVIVNCVFNDNSATGADTDNGGGAIYCNCSNPSVSNCTFSGNEATNGFGGAVLCYSSSPSLADCTFSDNSAHKTGGAIYCRYNSKPTIVNCVFSNNTADDKGGAIFCKKNSSVKITNCTFSNNSASYYGGAIYCTDSSGPTVTNCVFCGNSASNNGGAIYCVSSAPTATNCTFSGNEATNFFGGAIVCSSSSTFTLNNSILWGNSAGAGGNEIYIDDTGSSCVLNYCCVNSTGYGFGSGVPTTTIDDSNNCIFVNPQFVDAAGGDYHLKDTSPCIDAGDNGYVPSGVDKDLDGNERIVDGNNDGTATVDIGAYEHQ